MVKYILKDKLFPFKKKVLNHWYNYRKVAQEENYNQLRYIFGKRGSEKKIPSAKYFSLRQRTLSIKANAGFLCLKKPHPLFMLKKNVSCY